MGDNFPRIIAITSLIISLLTLFFEFYKWHKKEKYVFQPPKKAIHPRHFK